MAAVGRPRRTQEDFIRLAVAMHGDYFSYVDVDYQGAKKPVAIGCPRHGIFFQTPATHLRGGGCKACNQENQKITFEEFRKRVEKVHSSKYSYSPEGWRGSDLDVLIECPTHGLFSQNLYIHLQGSGCPRCSRVTNTEDFILQSREVHGSTYNYSQVIYHNTRDKVEILCKVHGSFQQTPNMHLLGNGCPRCKASKGEQQIERYLRHKGVEFQTQVIFPDLVNPKTGQSLKFDFFIPKHNLLLEFDGVQHFQPTTWFNSISQEMASLNFELQQERDSLKNCYAVARGFKLLRISHLEDATQILNNHFSKETL